MLGIHINERTIAEQNAQPHELKKVLPLPQFGGCYHSFNQDLLSKPYEHVKSTLWESLSDRIYGHRSITYEARGNLKEVTTQSTHSVIRPKRKSS